MQGILHWFYLKIRIVIFFIGLLISPFLQLFYLGVYQVFSLLFIFIFSHHIQCPGRPSRRLPIRPTKLCQMALARAVRCRHRER